MTQKMNGFIAELKTFTAHGKEVDSEFVFIPTCEWYIEKLGDYLGCTKYHDIGAVIDDFGIDVAEKIIEGQVVAVERELSDTEIAERGLRQTSCIEPVRIEKTRSTIQHPYRGGSKEYLIKHKGDKINAPA